MVSEDELVELMGASAYRTGARRNKTAQMVALADAEMQTTIDDVPSSNVVSSSPHLMDTPLLPANPEVRAAIRKLCTAHFMAERSRRHSTLESS